MLPRNELPENHRLLGNPAFGGFRLFCNWRDLEPSYGQTDFSRIDNAIHRAGVHGQKLLVSINFGKGAGEWIFGKPHPSTKFPFDFDGDGVAESLMGLGFDPTYQRKVNDLIAKLAYLYDDEEVVSGFVMTGAERSESSFTFARPKPDIQNWEAAAVAAGFPDKHQAIQTAARYRIDQWTTMFNHTPLMFCAGNPWSNPSGKADEEAVLEYAKGQANSGICTEFLRASQDYDENQGKVVSHPYTEEPVSASSDPNFYRESPDAMPEAPEPVHALLMTGYNLGATMVELWEADALNEANHETVAADAQKLISNAG